MTAFCAKKSIIGVNEEETIENEKLEDVEALIVINLKFKKQVGEILFNLEDNESQPSKYYCFKDSQYLIMRTENKKSVKLISCDDFKEKKIYNISHNRNIS